MGTQSGEGTYLKEMAVSGVWIVDGAGSYSLALWFWRTKCSQLLTRCSPDGSDPVWGHGLLNQPSRAWLGLTSVQTIVQTKAGRSQGLGKCQVCLTPWGGHTELVIHGPSEPETCFSVCQTFLLLRASESGPSIQLVSSLTWDEDVVWAGFVWISQKWWEPSCVFLVTHWFSNLSQDDCMEVRTARLKHFPNRAWNGEETGGAWDITTPPHQHQPKSLPSPVSLYYFFLILFYF